MRRKPSIALRLLLGGMVLYSILWFGLDGLHNRELGALVDYQLIERLEQKAARDTLRVEQLLHAHQTFSALLAQSEGARRESLEPWRGPNISITDGEPSWLSGLMERRSFPPVDFVFLTKRNGTIVRSWRLDPSVVLTPDMAAEVSGSRPGVKGNIPVVSGQPMMMSSADILGANDGRLVLVSLVNSKFIKSTLGSFLDRGFAVTLSEVGSGRILATSNPAQLPLGDRIGRRMDDFLVSPPHLLAASGEGAPQVALSSILSRGERHAALAEPYVELERRHRTVLSAAAASLFIVGGVYVSWRIRKSRRRISRIAERVFGNAGLVPVGGDELDELEAAVAHLAGEVERSRSALHRQELQKTRLLTEQMALETENERLKLLQAVTEEMGIGVIRIGPDGPAAENSVMRSFMEVADGLEVFIRAKIRGESLIHVGPLDNERIFEVMVAPQVDAGLVLVRDVTAEGRAKEAMDTFVQFPSQNPHPVLRVDHSGVVTHSNPASERLLQFWATAVGQRLPPKWASVFAEVLASGERREVEVTIGERVLTLYLVPLPGAGVVNLYGADVTGRVAAERLLHIVNENLERRVQQRTEALEGEIHEHVRAKRELVAAIEAAQYANRSKTEFLANVSHELRTPLNAVIGFSEVMAAEMFGQLGDRRYKAYAEDILASGRHLLDVINDILDISRIEAGQLEFQITEVDPVEVSGAAIRIVESRAETGGLKLRANLQHCPSTIRADRRRLLQILVNLLGNSVKFTPPGGEVILDVGTDGEAVKFMVRDTGIGMSDDEILVAMEPFRQVDSGLGRRYEGAGLGLPLVRAFTELHGGQLDIVSAKGKGTTVTVTLPSRDVIAKTPCEAGSSA
ncbi:PAS domain-containing sensor histidine kinase [Paramagnetospirillum kuznetsovii]|uniref:histidine kinase n=1 Tax=Paramagnetospirillum kuznetsovii TaxID=2053833 RepID=A0A364P002_9PROT|nr:ATP-binding protein [Paramagnetospirillum kuznetsovii]RAU22661.1 PAS domain-containing sensor histidine kinase [Paramagnetospirillum kuznetsovii]